MVISIIIIYLNRLLPHVYAVHSFLGYTNSGGNYVLSASVNILWQLPSYPKFKAAPKVWSPPAGECSCVLVYSEVLCGGVEVC